MNRTSVFYITYDKHRRKVQAPKVYLILWPVRNNWEYLWWMNNIKALRTYQGALFHVCIY